MLTYVSAFNNGAPLPRGTYPSHLNQNFGGNDYGLRAPTPYPRAMNGGNDYRLGRAPPPRPRAMNGGNDYRLAVQPRSRAMTERLNILQNFEANGGNDYNGLGGVGTGSDYTSKAKPKKAENAKKEKHDKKKDGDRVKGEHGFSKSFAFFEKVSLGKASMEKKRFLSGIARIRGHSCLE